MLRGVARLTPPFSTRVFHSPVRLFLMTSANVASAWRSDAPRLPNSNRIWTLRSCLHYRNRHGIIQLSLVHIFSAYYNCLCYARVQHAFCRFACLPRSRIPPRSLPAPQRTLANATGVTYSLSSACLPTCSPSLNGLLVYGERLLRWHGLAANRVAVLNTTS